jgi:hypothetical protein
MNRYRITSADTARSLTLTQEEAEAQFGREEWAEIRAGYLPHLIVEHLECDCEECK